MNVDIETALRERDTLANRISEALQDFNVKTGLRVSGINFNVIDARGMEDMSKGIHRDLYSVDIRVEL